MRNNYIFKIVAILSFIPIEVKVNRSKGQCLLYYLQYWLLPKGMAWESPVAWTWSSYANENNLKSSFRNRETLWGMRVVGLGKANVPVDCCLLSLCRKQ